MIDLHNHLLPAIDDGAKVVDETVEFLRILARDGVTDVTATPHMKPGVYDNTRTDILRAVEEVRRAAAGDPEAGAVRLHPGAEVEGTFHGFSGQLGRDRIDFVLVTEGVVTRAAEVLRPRPGGRFVSDHEPVAATVVLPVNP